MSEIIIRNLADVDLTVILPELKNIFFESSSRKDFANENEKDHFYQKYLGFYLEHFSKFTWIAQSQKVLGYITGMTSSDHPELLKLQPHLKEFVDLFEKFPAHLHINLHHEARGLGLGSKLLLEFEKGMKQQHATGVHLMTSPDARNRTFYEKNGYSFQVERNYMAGTILFLGKTL